jgi:hypothetical protein
MLDNRQKKTMSPLSAFGLLFSLPLHEPVQYIRRHLSNIVLIVIPPQRAIPVDTPDGEHGSSSASLIVSDI